MVFTAVLLLTLAGIWSLQHVPLDALPDISDVQVIVHTGWAGEPPDVIEDQVTYPIVTSLLAAPHVKAVRAQTMLGDSYVYVVFEDGTDLYWALACHRIPATDQRASAGERASFDRTRCDRRRMGLRICHRR
jgi:Cu(I)/Ag(I) efflux system membrane protein CusA/SilA